MFCYVLLQAKFLNEPYPRLLPLYVFSWDANPLSKIFCGCQNGKGFSEVWQKEIVPYLSQTTGVFENGEPAVVEQPASSTRSPSLSPPSLMPTAKNPCTVDTTDETEMDRAIQDHFLGEFMLTCLALLTCLWSV